MTRWLTPSAFAWCRPTDAQGRFRVHIPRGKSLFLAAEAAGYVAEMQEVAPDPDRPPVEFRLVRGKRLRGRVVDPSGHPIEGAWVFALGDSPKVIAGQGGQQVIASEPKLHFRSCTDEHGCFDWENAPAEAVLFHIGAKSYVAVEAISLAASDRVAEITLRPAVDVRLAAIDARTREPIPRYRVRIGTQDPRTNGFRWRPPIGRSAPRQVEAVLAAEEGPYHFEISADGYVPARLLVPRERTILRKNIALEKAAR